MQIDHMKHYILYPFYHTQLIDWSQMIDYIEVIKEQ
jgi:hypothetical protein